MTAVSVSELGDLVARGCSRPGCTHDHHGEEVWLHAECHPRSGVCVAYKEGAIFMHCKECGRPLGAIAVALVPMEVEPLDLTEK
jgi:hypothetical protein